MIYSYLMQSLMRAWYSCRVKPILKTLGLFTTGLLLPTMAQAIGFGPAQGEAVIGMPLSVEVEVFNAERSNPECFEIKPNDAEGESSFFPRHARLELKKTDEGKTFLIVSGETIQEPVVEFRLRTSCGSAVERRYTLLAAPPPELLPAAAVALPAVPEPQPRALPATASEASVSAPTGVTLNQLARQRYPLQPKARAKFKRLIKSANPELALADDELLPVPPSALKYPPNLPKRRTGPYRPARPKAVPPTPKPIPAAETAVPPPAAEAAAPEPPAPQTDRLVIAQGAGEKGQAPSAQENALAGKAESSFAAQEEMIARLAKAEAAYQSLQERLQLMENRMRALEMEKEQLQRQQEALSQSALIELIISVLVGGAFGALLMSIWLRRKAAKTASVIGF